MSSTLLIVRCIMQLSLLSTSAKTGILYRAQRARSRVLITQKAPSTQARDRYHEALQIVKQCQEHLEQASKDHRFETSGIVSQRMNLKEIRRMLGISPLKDLMDPQAENARGNFFRAWSLPRSCPRSLISMQTLPWGEPSPVKS